MKILYTILFSLIFSSFLISQNVGIGTNTPREKLEVNGAILIGDETNDSIRGTIRYNSGIYPGGGFEGRLFNKWERLGLPRNALVFSDFYNDRAFLESGYEYYGNMLQTMKTYQNIPASIYQSDSWYPIYSKGNPQKESNPNFRSNVVWRDSVIYVYAGGGGVEREFAYYNPATNCWKHIGTSISGNYSYLDGKLFWYNNEFIFVTGDKSNPGFRFNPITMSVVYLPNMATSYNRKTKFKSELIQNRIIIYGGDNDNVRSNDGMNYNILDNTWTPMSQTNGPPVLKRYATTKLAQEFVVWGGILATSDLEPVSTGYIYSVQSNTWFPMVTGNTPKARANHTLTNIDGDKLFMFGGAVWNGLNGLVDTSDAMVYDYFQGWMSTSAVDFPGHDRLNHTAASHNGIICVYGGQNLFPIPGGNGSVSLTNGFVYDVYNGNLIQDMSPSLLYTRIRLYNGNERLNGESVFNGNQYFVIGGFSSPDNDTDNEQMMYNVSNIGEPSPTFYNPRLVNNTMHIYRKK